MLSKENQVATLNLAMQYEIEGYQSETMHYFMLLMKGLPGDLRDDILTFLQTFNTCTFKLYCEIVSRLNSNLVR